MKQSWTFRRQWEDGRDPLAASPYYRTRYVYKSNKMSPSNIGRLVIIMLLLKVVVGRSGIRSKQRQKPYFHATIAIASECGQDRLTCMFMLTGQAIIIVAVAANHHPIIISSIQGYLGNCRLWQFYFDYSSYFEGSSYFIFKFRPHLSKPMCPSEWMDGR